MQYVIIFFVFLQTTQLLCEAFLSAGLSSYDISRCFVLDALPRIYRIWMVLRYWEAVGRIGGRGNEIYWRRGGYRHGWPHSVTQIIHFGSPPWRRPRPDVSWHLVATFALRSHKYTKYSRNSIYNSSIYNINNRWRVLS